MRKVATDQGSSRAALLITMMISRESILVLRVGDRLLAVTKQKDQFRLIAYK